MQSGPARILVTAAPGKHVYGASQKGLSPAPMYPGGRDSATAVTFKIATEKNWIAYPKDPENVSTPIDIEARRHKVREAMRRLRKGLPNMQRITKRMLSDKPVYVDFLFEWVEEGYSKDSRHNFHARRTGARHGHQWCHMWSEDLNNLHYMANKIGLRREWFQNRKGFPHYDLVPTKRKLAIALGAVEISLKDYMNGKRVQPKQMELKAA